jgi:hypothetical protein
MLGLSTAFAADENFYQCMNNPETISAATAAGVMQQEWCADRHFDTSPRHAQARVLVKRLDQFKKDDPGFKEYYESVRSNSLMDIYSDYQVVLRYIDKRPVKKD